MVFYLFDIEPIMLDVMQLKMERKLKGFNQHEALPNKG